MCCDQCLDEFPFFDRVYRIAFEGADPHSITDLGMHPMSSAKSKSGLTPKAGGRL